MGGLDTAVHASTRRCTCATSRCSATCRRRACSPTPAAPTRATPSSRAASARCSAAAPARRRASRKAAKFDWSINFIPYHDDVEGRAAELDHRRRVAVGDGRQEAATSTRAWRSSSPSCRSPRCRWTGTPSTGYVPITQAAYELTTQVRLLRQEPGRRPAGASSSPTRRRPRTPRACASATSCRGATVIEEELESVFAGKKDAEGRARRRGASAATRSCASSRRRTSNAARRGAAPAPCRPPAWKSASSSGRRGCRTRWSRRRSRSRSSSSSGRRRRRSGTRSSCRTRSA